MTKESQKDNHPHFLRLAIEAAGTNIAGTRGGPFGAAVVKEGEVIAIACNQVVQDNDPTAHAEIVAIREACRKLGTFQLDDCIIYASCEPCPMCLGAIYWARPQAIYYAAHREDAAAIGFDDAHIYQQIPLPPKRRSIPAINMLRQEAIAVFRAWEASGSRIPY
jgi:tRNA(Arg) A34 adenosine deaminase TadA